MVLKIIPKYSIRVHLTLILKHKIDRFFKDHLKQNELVTLIFLKNYIFQVSKIKIYLQFDLSTKDFTNKLKTCFVNFKSYKCFSSNSNIILQFR